MDHERNVTVLLLEEEALIAMDAEFNLVQAGLSVVGVFARCSEALEWLSINTPSVVIMDVRLQDGPCGELAHTIHSRGIPFVVHSSNCPRKGHFDEAFSHAPWILKPCDPDDLSDAVLRCSQLSVRDAVARHSAAA